MELPKLESKFQIFQLKVTGLSVRMVKKTKGLEKRLLIAFLIF